MPPEPIYFVDRSIASQRVLDALRAAGATFVRHDDLFAQDTPDTVWLAEAGRQRWVVLTMDQRIRYNRLEREALLANGVGAVIMVAKNLSGAQTAACLVAALPRLRTFVAQTPLPFVAKLYADGRLERLALT